MRNGLARKVGLVLGVAGLLAGVNPTSAQETGKKYSNTVTDTIRINYPPFRRIYINEDDKIWGIAQQKDPSYGETDFIKKIGGQWTKISITPEIEKQYFLLRDPYIASQLGIDWKNERLWKMTIDLDLFDSLQQTEENPFKDDTLEDTVEGYVIPSIGGNTKLIVEDTEEGVLRTIMAE